MSLKQIAGIAFAGFVVLAGHTAGAQAPTQATSPKGETTPAAAKPATSPVTPGVPGTPGQTTGAPGATTPRGATTPVQTTAPGQTTTPTQNTVPGQPARQGPVPIGGASPGRAVNPGAPLAAPGTTPLNGGAVPGTALPSAPASLGPGISTDSVSAGVNAGGQPAQSGPAITLDEALTRARANEPTFVAAQAAAKTAALDRSIARAALLPTATYHNQFLYTQPNGAQNQAGSTGTQAAPRFIANNTVHEYISQGVVSETIGLTQLTAVSRATAAAAIANAELEISRRGLTSTVVGLFYSSSTAQSRVAIQQRALAEAADFVKQTQQREAEREAAHADVIKAQLTLQQRQRDLADALVAVAKARIDLGVLLFPDPMTSYSVSLPTPVALPSKAQVEAAANNNNPELRSAAASLRSTNLGILAARAAYLPDLALNYTYGIDAPQFSTKGPDGTTNLGYSASATLDIPVWDWFATRDRIRQARILRDAAKVTLTATQRTLIARLNEFYAEAELSQQQLESLDQSVQMAAESLRLTKLRYSNGESTVLEVVDAQNTLTTTELARTDGTVRYQLALANLQTLTGTI